MRAWSGTASDRWDSEGRAGAARPTRRSAEMRDRDGKVKTANTWKPEKKQDFCAAQIRSATTTIRDTVSHNQSRHLIPVLTLNQDIKARLKRRLYQNRIPNLTLSFLCLGARYRSMQRSKRSLMNLSYWGTWGKSNVSAADNKHV